MYFFNLFLDQLFIKHLLALYRCSRNGGCSSKQNSQYFVLLEFRFYWADNMFRSGHDKFYEEWWNLNGLRRERRCYVTWLVRDDYSQVDSFEQILDISKEESYVNIGVRWRYSKVVPDHHNKASCNLFADGSSRLQFVKKMQHLWSAVKRNAIKWDMPMSEEEE